MKDSSTDLKICMAMLATSGGSSIVAQSIGQSITASHSGFDIRYCHLRADQLQHNHYLLDTNKGCANSKLLDAPPSFGSSMDSVSELLRIHDKWRFDLLHVHNLQVYGLSALMLKQIRNIPYMITCHGSDILNQQLFDQNIEVAAEILRNASAITCVSNHLANALTDKINGLNNIQGNNIQGNDIQVNDIQVINNFISPDWQQVEQERHVQKNKFLHVSSMRNVKRPQVLLQAFNALQQQIPQAQLSIVTTSEGVNRVNKMLRSGIHSGEGINLIDGDASPNALAEEYATAQAMVLTSQFEGFGLVVLEALQHHLPVIAPSVGALPEVLGKQWPYLIDEQDESQLATKTAEAMAKVAMLNSDSLKAQIESIIARFQGPQQISQYTKLYHQVSKQHRG